jgi:hypothetical protein
MESKQSTVLLLLGVGAVAVAFLLRPKAQAKADPVGDALGAASGVVRSLTPIVSGVASSAGAVYSLPGLGVKGATTVTSDVYSGAKTVVNDIYSGGKKVVNKINPANWF